MKKIENVFSPITVKFMLYLESSHLCNQGFLNLYTAGLETGKKPLLHSFPPPLSGVIINQGVEWAGENVGVDYWSALGPVHAHHKSLLGNSLPLHLTLPMKFAWKKKCYV